MKRLPWILVIILTSVVVLQLTMGTGESQSSNLVVAATDWGTAGVLAFCENGDVYSSNTAEFPEWTYEGNIFNGAVEAQKSTWGQVKARYRGGN